MSLHTLAQKHGRWTRKANRPRIIATTLITMLTITAVLYYAKIASGVSPTEKITLNIPAYYPERVCLQDGNSVYCADNEANLVTAIKTNWDEQPAPETPQQKTVMGVITQYSRADSCHNVVNGKCLMASGKPVYEGAVACPKNIPLGTKVRINGQIYTCEDRTADWVQKRNGPTFDIFVEQNPTGKFLTNIEIL